VRGVASRMPALAVGLLTAAVLLISATTLLVAIPASAAPPSSTHASIPAPAAKAKANSPRHSCAYANLRPTAADAVLLDAATLCLIDRLRTAYRLRPLRANRELQAVAGAQATAMVRDDYFGDDSPSGQTPATLIEALPYGAHASSLTTAQNLGWGTRSAATPAGIVTAWMHSPPHREVILTGAFREIGVGVWPAVPAILGHGQRGATYAVELAVRG
jgi:uncharacterized protein YkwD